MADNKGNGRLDVFTIVERGSPGSGEGSDGKAKKYWVRVGAAFVNADESLNVYLDATPVNEQLQIRPPFKDNPDRDGDRDRDNDRDRGRDRARTAPLQTSGTAQAGNRRR